MPSLVPRSPSVYHTILYSIDRANQRDVSGAKLESQKKTHEQTVSDEAYHIIQALACEAQPIVRGLSKVDEILRGPRVKQQAEVITEVHERRDTEEDEEKEADPKVW